MLKDNQATKDRFITAVFTGDRASMRELLDQNVEIHQSSHLEYGGIYKGVDGFFVYLDKFMATYDIEVLQNTRTYILENDPDTIAVELRIRATLISSGKVFESTIIQPWTFKNGKILKIVSHWFETPI